jgi:MYXO-CTERM domain-containing protein
LVKLEAKAYGHHHGIMNLSSDPITLAMPEVKSRGGAPFIFDGDSLRNVLKVGEDASFVLDTSALGGGIPPEGSASFTVAFKPQQAGDAANEVQVYLEGESVQVYLEGESEPEVRIPMKGIGRALTGQGSGCACGTTDVGSAGMLALVGLSSRQRKRG